MNRDVLWKLALSDEMDTVPFLGKTYSPLEKEEEPESTSLLPKKKSKERAPMSFDNPNFEEIVDEQPAQKLIDKSHPEVDKIEANFTLKTPYFNLGQAKAYSGEEESFLSFADYTPLREYDDEELKKLLKEAEKEMPLFFRAMHFFR